MNSAHVTADDVAPIIDEMAEVALSGLMAAKQAALEVERLKAELESRDKVILEKIANEEKSIFDDQEIDNTMNQLEAFGFIDPEHRTKIASELRKDPNKALVLIGRIAELSTPMPEEGKPATKQASHGDSDVPLHIRNKYPKKFIEDGTWKIIEYGA